MSHYVIGEFKMMSSKDFASKQIIVIRTKEGEKLSFLNDNIVVKDNHEKTVLQATCYRVFAIFIIGHITITSGLIQRSKKFGFSIILLTNGFRPYQILNAEAEGNVLLRAKQYNYKGIEIAKHIVYNKIENQRSLLMSQREKNDEIIQCIKKLDEYLCLLDDANSIQSIMGYEGNASKLYFKNYFDNVAWKRRSPRTKTDMINALLDIGYTILFCYIDAIASLFGFDKYCGFLHQQFYLRKSLICDLVEPFRVIIDKQTKKSINLGQFKERDFTVYDNRWCLNYKISSKYCSIYFSAINEHKEEIFVYIRDFYRTFMRDKEIPTWREE